MHGRGGRTGRRGRHKSAPAVSRLDRGLRLVGDHGGKAVEGVAVICQRPDPSEKRVLEGICAPVRRSRNALLKRGPVVLCRRRGGPYGQQRTYDVLIIGAGHNGLTCAAYLGRAGLKVKVVERRPVVGGAAVTEEFHPGFRNSVASYTVSLLNPKVIRDLDLNGHGLKIVERRATNFLPTLDGRYLLAGEGRTKREIAKFSAATPSATTPSGPRSKPSPTCCAASSSAHRPT